MTLVFCLNLLCFGDSHLLLLDLEHIKRQARASLANAIALLMVVVPGIVVVNCKTRAQFSGRFQSVGSFPFEDLLGIDDCLHLLLLILDMHLHLYLDHVGLEFVELLLVLESYELLWHQFNIE